jgi:exodeoxyribonuclease-1
LLFRYRARNFPESLSPQEAATWQAFCRTRLSNAEAGAPNTLEQFEAALINEWPQADAAQQQVLQVWREHVAALREKYRL